MSANNTKNNKATASLYGRSYANVDLGVFLVFFGIVAAVPLYALVMNIVFKQPDIKWRTGIIIGLVSVGIGYLLIRHSKRCFRVTSHSDGSGSISIREGLLRHPQHYSYSAGSFIQLNIADSSTGAPGSSLMQISLIDGSLHFTLDIRPFSKMQESRTIAEFLSKNSGLKLRMPYYDNLEIEAADLDLPFPERVKKYPTLIGLEPSRPEGCPISIKDLNAGNDRRYSWGFRANGLLGQLCALLMVAFALACLPLFEDGEGMCSLLDFAMRTKDYTYFYAGFAALGIIAFIFCGLGMTVTAEGFRINADYQLWWITYKHRSILLSKLEEISTKDTSSGAAVHLIADDQTISIRMANSVLANYLASDLRHFIANK